VGGFALVDAEGVAVWVGDEGHVADWGFDGAELEGDVGGLEGGDGGGEVVDFEGDGAADGAGLEAWGDGDGEGGGADFVFDPVCAVGLVVHVEGEAEDALVEGAGAGHVGDWVAGEGDVEDFHGGCFLGVRVEWWLGWRGGNPYGVS